MNRHSRPSLRFISTAQNYFFFHLCALLALQVEFGVQGFVMLVLVEMFGSAVSRIGGSL